MIGQTKEGEDAGGRPPEQRILLATKLHVPENPFYLVARERLYDIMSRALRCKLTSVIAPPGYGKTTLVGSWLRSTQVRFGWVSLDKGENDRLRFWTYVAEALQSSLPVSDEVTENGRRISPYPFTAERAAAWLIARMGDSGEPVVLVLDDYHVIESEEIHSDLSMWIDRLPAHMHVCLLSRKEIPFPVGAMRAKGSLLELDMSELRFTEEEIVSYWTRRTGAEPDDSLLQELARSTEGWAAMLQLSVLSRSGSRIGTRRPLSGRHRHVVDYLMEEVFGKLPGEIKRFLVCTSILERMNDSLCAVVTDEPESPAMLPELERGGLFLIALDNERCWYRYHHLLADFLQSRLPYEGIPDISLLHGRAAAWFEAHGYMSEAIHHALEAGAFGQAADWLEAHAAIWLKRRETTTLLNWLDRLPEETADRPLLILLRVWTELMAGLGERAIPRISGLKESIKRWVTVDEYGLLTRLREEVQIVDNVCAVWSGDFDRALRLIRQLGEREELPAEHVSVMISHGIELNEGTVPFIRGKFGFKGRIGQAEAYHRSYGYFLEKNGLHEFPFTAYQQAALSEVLYERNELEAAHDAAQQAVHLGWTFGVLGAYVPAVICLADVLWADSRKEEAIELVEQGIWRLEARHLHTTHWFDKLTAKWARQQMSLGNAEEARSWSNYWQAKAVNGYGTLSDCDPATRFEIGAASDYEWLTYIRALLAQGEMEAAGEFTDKLLSASRHSGNLMSELQGLLLGAEICSMQRRLVDSNASLHAALLLGEREGYLRTFLDASPFVVERLVGMNRNDGTKGLYAGITPDYVRSICSAASVTAVFPEKLAPLSGIATGPDALTPREREVLRLMARGLTNKAIAAALVVTEGTVKLHLHRIYGKLHTSGRVQAIRAAERLGLLGDSPGS
jgi:LuxR family maltose regulon positive regulatory protein